MVGERPTWKLTLTCLYFSCTLITKRRRKWLRWTWRLQCIFTCALRHQKYTHHTPHTLVRPYPLHNNHTTTTSGKNKVQKYCTRELSIYNGGRQQQTSFYMWKIAVISCFITHVSVAQHQRLQTSHAQDWISVGVWTMCLEYISTILISSTYA